MYNCETNINIRKKNILRIAKLFFVVIIVLTFFSKTIYNWTLPKVKVDETASGSLTREISGKGIVEAKGRVEYYTSVEASVLEVKASPGDMVQKGDVLMILDTNALVDELAKKKLEIDEDRLLYEQMELALNSSTFENETKILYEELVVKEKEYNSYKKLYEQQAISKKDFEDKEKEYTTAKLKYENAKKEQFVGLKKLRSDLKIKSKNIEVKELEIKKLDNDLQKLIIKAADSGMVKEINFKKGMLTNDSEPVYIIDNSSKGFLIKVNLPSKQCEYLAIGDSARVIVKNGEGNQIDGVIKAINSRDEDTESKSVIIDLSEAELKGEETCEVYIDKKIGEYDYIVPRAAVHEDNNGKYVLVLQEKDGPLGKEYYASKQSISVGDSDLKNMGVYSGLLGGEKIIVYSNKLISDGERVILEK